MSDHSQSSDDIARPSLETSSEDIRTLSELTTVMADGLRQFNDVTERQWAALASIAGAIAKTAHALGAGGRIGEFSTGKEAAAAAAQLREAAAKYKESTEQAWAGLTQINSDMALPSEGECRNQAFVNTVSCLNLLMRNAAANQQHLNQIGAAIITLGAAKLYSASPEQTEYIS